MYRKIFKRLIDIAASLGALVILAVPMIIFALIIKHEDSGPALFAQKRVGRGKKFFNMYKFRSMKLNTPHDVPTHLLEDPEKYILHCGRWMRKYSIDELPQIINILKGDMSIVGPRPALWNQDDLISERDKYGANNIRPGLTGWAQINGRDELEIPVKAKFDGEYVKRESFMFDLLCIIKTFTNVFKHKGVIEGGTGAINKL
ncbi:MAG: sugar transferase [Synergistaceae bacterium]|nr:sugar transferase [Synergistaceae bacterium]